MGYRTSTQPFALWLRKSNWTAPRLAAELKVTKSVVYQWAAGQCRPTAEHLAALSRLTDGAVAAWMFA
jgi:transcriptional regulator with XRE-family HTH domain